MRASSTPKRILSLLLCIAVLLCSASAFADTTTTSTTSETDTGSDTPAITNAPMAILYEQSTDTYLFSLNSYAHNPPASMTKVMTALLVLEYDPELSGTMVVPAEAVSERYCYWMEFGHLVEGEEISVWELMKYLLIPSGNEAGTTLAVYVAGDIPTFVNMMNEKAAELGMTDTHFEDPHGLSPDSYISARDMLTLSIYAMQYEKFREIVRMTEGELPASNKRDEPFPYETSNTVINPGNEKVYQRDYTDDILGIKTGYINEAGRNLASAMVKDDLTFYSVVMHCTATLEGRDMVYGHYNDTLKLFDYARQFEKQGFAAGDTVCEMELWGWLSGGKTVPFAAKDDIYILAREGSELELDTQIEINGSSVKKGETVGTLTLRDQFGNVRQTELVAAEDGSISLLLPITAISIIVIVAVVIILAVKHSKKRKAAQESTEDKQENQ